MLGSLSVGSAKPGSGKENENTGSFRAKPRFGNLNVGSFRLGSVKPGSGNARFSVGSFSGNPGSGNAKLGSVSDGSEKPGIGKAKLGSVKLHALANPVSQGATRTVVDDTPATPETP